MTATAVQHYEKSAGATEFVVVDFSPRLAVVNEGTLSSATSTTAVLDEGASTSNDTYNSFRLKATSGTGASEGLSYAITDYVGATRTATLAWQTTGDSSTTYEIIDVITTLTSIVEVTTTALTLASKAITTEITYDRDGSPVPIGQGLEFTVAGGTAGVSYKVRCTAVSVRGETMELDVIVDVV